MKTSRLSLGRSLRVRGEAATIVANGVLCAVALGGGAVAIFAACAGAALVNLSVARILEAQALAKAGASALPAPSATSLRGRSGPLPLA